MPDLSAKPNRSSPLVRSAALDALSERFRPALLRYFRRRVNDASEAEHLVQEVLLRMLRRRNVATAEDARGYLFETASRVLIDRSRRLKARPSPEQDAGPSITKQLNLVEGLTSVSATPQRRGLARAAALAAICLVGLAAFHWLNLKR